MLRSNHKTTHLSIVERTKIEIWCKQGVSISEIARRLSRSKSTIWNELHRYKNTELYRAERAHARAGNTKQRCRKPSKADNPDLMQDIERLIKRRWSPDIIAHALGKVISHTTIYTIIRTIRREWRKYLIYQKKTKYHKGVTGKHMIPNRTDISIRPRVQFGDYEADTVISSREGKSCLGVFVERTTKLYKIAKMPDKSSKSMTDGTLLALRGLPVNSITYDNGTENSDHWITNMLLGCASYFCRAYRSGDKGLVENRNKILRQFLSKKTNFDLISESELIRIENEINERPMKCLNWMSPKQAFINALSFGLQL